MNLRTVAIITFLSVAAFTGSCLKEDTTSQQLDKVKSETKEAAQEMKDYPYAQKAEFTEKVKNQLAELNRELDLISAKVEKSSDTVKAEAKPKIQTLREQTTRLNKQLDEARNATESTWNDVKAGFKKGYDELKDEFQKARQWVSDKIAPEA
jgi:cytochrome c556